MIRIAVEHPRAADIDTLHALLRETYWSPGIPREVVERACSNSMCAIARDKDGAFAGFARLVTDRATFAWLCDVIVLPAHQGKGVARDLVRAFQGHPELQNLRRWLLGTRDAHGVYAPLGFSAIGEPSRMMEIRNPSPYGVAAS